MTIEPDGDNVVVCGRCSKSRLQGQESKKPWAGVKRIGAKLAEVVLKPAPEPELDFVSFTRTYSPTDIDQFDQQASQRRTKADHVPDIYTLGERLRTIGKVIDSPTTAASFGSSRTNSASSSSTLMAAATHANKN